MPDTTEQVLASLVERTENRFYGKYRGTVQTVDDPESLGRLRAFVPSVLGPDVATGWATPCVPYGGAPGTGLQLLPEPGAGVWIEFEEGDLEFPIWVGTFWSSPGRTPETPPVTGADGVVADTDRGRPAPKILRTAKGHTLQLDDTDDDEKVTLVDGAHRHVITLDGSGITVRDGVSGHSIVLGPDGITIEDGRHAGNAVTMDDSGTTIADAHGHQVVLGAGGIQIGQGATEAIVLGTRFKANVAAFLIAYAAHTHTVPVATPNTPVLSTPPVVSGTLDVPLSATNTVGS